jgi:zinc transport system substrate-binding protein
MKRTILLIIGFIILITLIAVSFSARNKQDESGKLTVVGSFYPLAHFAQQVGGDKVTVTNVVPAGVEPHDFEPTPRDIATIQSAKLFLMNGSGLDSWAEKAATSLTTTKTLTMANEISLITTESEADHDHDAEQADEHAAATDPHFWLDPILAKQEVATIKQALIELDPQNAQYYEENARAYNAKLDKLDADYRGQLASCTQREIITTHAAFGYLAKQYSIEVTPIAGLSPEEEPSAKSLAQLSELAKQKSIRYILFETLTSPQLADTLASEIGAKTLVFNPLEGLTSEEQAAGANYISIMNENLITLKTAMQCQ